MLACLPDMLDGLLHMLSDPNREIRQQADSALGDFLAEIRGRRGGGDAIRSRTIDFGAGGADAKRGRVHARHRRHVVARVCVSRGPRRLGRHPRGHPSVSRFADILGAVLPCLSHAEPKVRDVAEKASDELLAAAVDAARADEETTMSLRERSEKAEKTPPKPSPSTSSPRGGVGFARRVFVVGPGDEGQRRGTDDARVAPMVRALGACRDRARPIVDPPWA